ncbi:DNA-directed RNA polymerases I and III subunit RPAC2 [Acrodontium crateriforme]|uniref:DNA-directed RNA polymerases I and III subunit RPAC2 n=1 Tax=Acrodontium crateriforme TaxID=150365 RepID=A0AAQ3RD02_9PEZI|nr:DNA-directed RNA polymerases I and III subunit RPAC2 [Acrodontium crateriforme]
MSAQDNDREMADVNETATVDFSRQKQRLRLLPGSTETAASFAFDQEDHTLGNALRYMIMKNPDVEFCGYSIPHPSEATMNLRIQTWDGVSALEVLRKGLNDLADLCDVVEDTFTVSRDKFNAANSEQMSS